MADQMTLERLEKQVAQLSPNEQLKLVAHISERLSVAFEIRPEGKGEPDKKDRRKDDIPAEGLMKLIEKDDAFRFLYDPREDIYTVDDLRERYK